MTQAYMDGEESGKHNTAKETNRATAANPEEMEIYKQPDKEFKIIKEPNEMQETINRQ